MEKRTNVVCAVKARVEEPVSGSVMRWCQICAQEIWVSPYSIKMVESGGAYTLMCVDCSAGAMDATGVAEFSAHPTVMATLREQFTEEQVQEILRHIAWTNPPEAGDPGAE